MKGSKRSGQMARQTAGIRSIRKAPDVKRLAGFSTIRESIGADIEHGLSSMDELAMNLATGRVDHGNLKILIVGKATIEKVPREDAAMCNRVGIRPEFDADPVSERNTVDHIEEKFRHSRQP
jgi:hypothetical protein